MDAETLKLSNKRIAESLRAYNKALGKQSKAKEAYNNAGAEVQVAKEAYLVALEEAKKVVVS